ncbi:hypothetical protein M436DRAFT_73105 [Aureobasidium namibiae CBS 147.97]|uniref:Uncharacterized protein n=1 Tax=Aureobasidium namibiae CBS 147.97 TaxID=1043004 RepID=A0A074WT70_9PEZI|nr:uncharacterized protein M436DRAFT_73105 [Aureobasidium namibiae CBS 147.97]KEQ72957.1 hypothetical protein M436DRAFT_73105 [Aureobasidium namibiae CBS 147.97]
MFLRPLDYESPLDMPTSHFDKAFALLEQSFRDGNFLQAYKSLPSRQTTEKAESSRHADFSDDDDDDSDLSDGDMHEGYRPRDAPSISLMRRNSTLPPTPPTQSRNVSATYAHLVPLPREAAGTSTPPNQQRPPTPDLTPPNIRTKALAPPRPAIPHSASSRAESFMTARETQSQASASTSQASLPLRSEAGHRWLDATRGMRLSSLPLGIPERPNSLGESMSGSGETTPTQEPLRPFPAPAVSSHLVEHMTPEDLGGEASSTPDSEAGNFMRYVTIRKKRAAEPQQQTTPSQRMSTSNQQRSASAVMPLSEGANGSPSTVKHGETLDWLEADNGPLYQHMRNEKSKRLSAASTTSTVIEAFVLTAPHQQKQPALRRVSRVDTLRDDASSRRSSLESQHVLNPKIVPPRVRKHLVNGDVDAARSVSNPETGRVSKVPVIVIPERRSSRSSSSSDTNDKTHSLTSRQNRLHHSKNHVSLKRGYIEGETPRTSLDQEVDLNSDIWLDYASPEQEQPTPRTRLRHVSAPVHTNTDSSEIVSRNSFHRVNGQDAKIKLSSQQGWKRHSIDAELESPELERPPRSSVERVRPTDHRLLLPSQQKNLSTQALSDYPQQTSPRKSSDSRDIRNLHSSTSPFSQLSDRTDSMELNEAKAVNLYPHGNRSLLMVQHVAKRRLAEAQNADEDGIIDALTTPDSEDEPTIRPSHPKFSTVLDAPTPHTFEDLSRAEVDSPLRNPRTAPQPPRLPAVIISPATPSSQFRETPAPPSPPLRRPSLVEKARRYSETLIQPFLTPSLSRRNSTSSQRPKSQHDRDTTLHPFWRPRGFWDDFTDSEEEYSDDELPSGGDTSDVQSLDSFEQNRHWRPKRLSVRLPGFRGQGGFMLGNSLGIDRHGTNVRRHHVSMTPANNQRLLHSQQKDKRSLLTRLFVSFPTLRKRQSSDLLRMAAQSTESLRRLSQRHKRRWDFGGLRSKMARRRERKEQVKRDRYRESIKGRIGAPVYVGT